MDNKHLAKKEMRGRKKINYFSRHYKNIQEIASRFLESESAGAYIGRALLAAIAFGGIMAIAAITPNIFSAFGKHYRYPDYSEKQLKRSFHYLRSKKLVKIINEENGITKIKITKLGKKKLMEFASEAISIKIPEEWDRKWRAIVFDVPEKYRASRDSIRRKLRELGFYQLQRSIFLHPYPIEDEILFIASLFDIERYVEILTIESMLDEGQIKKHFDL